MRETFFQCDHCHERVKSNSKRADYLQPVDVTVATGYYGTARASQAPASVHGDLCDDCLGAFTENVKRFFAGPETKA